MISAKQKINSMRMEPMPIITPDQPLYGKDPTRT
jgi:hypothetical protein